jgi:hypothetical protein
MSPEALAMAPFRWVEDPVKAFWLGSAVIAAVCVLVGQATSWVAWRLNGKHLGEHIQEARGYGKTSLRMLAAGQESHYPGVNRLANEAFGRAFFLSMAMNAAALWPVFLAAGWIAARFDGVRVPLGSSGFSLNPVAPLAVTYIGMRIAFARFARAVRFSRRRGAEAGADPQRGA